MTKLKVGVHGASGVIGKLLIDKINSSDDWVLSYPYSRKSEQFNNIDELFLSSEVIIDFSLAEAIDNLLLAASKHKKPLVIVLFYQPSDKRLSLHRTKQKIYGQCQNKLHKCSAPNSKPWRNAGGHARLLQI